MATPGYHGLCPPTPMPHDHDHDHGHPAHDGPPASKGRGEPDGHTDHGHGGHGHASHGHASHGHGGHDHSHIPAGTGERRLQLTLVLTTAWLVVEAVGGLITGSLALLADAGHMLSDAGALLIALLAIRIARRPPDARRTYGWKRAEVLGAMINGGTLMAIGGAIAMEAVDRWRDPTAVDGATMFMLAAGGLVVNLVAMAILSGGRSAGLNQRAAWLHVMSDALGSVGAMIAGLAVWAADWRLADPIASIAIAGLVVRASWSLLRDALDVLMESAPVHLDVDAIRAALNAQAGVLSVHDLHVWMLTPEEVALSGHIVTESDGPELLVRLCAMLREDYHIGHATLQVEPPGFDEAEMHP